MPELRELVEMVRDQTRPVPDAWEEQQRRQRRMARNRRMGAISLTAAIAVLAVLFALSRPDVTDRGKDTNQVAGPPGVIPSPSTSVSPTPVSGRTHFFEAPFTYALPPGWTVKTEGTWYFAWGPPERPEGWGDYWAFWVFSSFVPARSDCSDRPEQGVGRSSDAMTSWLSTHPALDATTPREVTLGGATGSWVDVQLADDWDYTCPGGHMGGLTLVTGEPDNGLGWSSIEPMEKIRFYVLDLPAGDTVTIVISTDAMYFDDVIDQAAPVVESFEFDD